MRQALELSITVIPASANLGASSSDVLPPAEKMATFGFVAMASSALTISEGRFNLFVENPGADETRNLRYRMKMHSREGKTYYFAGVKVVHDDPGFDLWRDMTTLFSTIHDGDGPDAPVLGKGKLQDINWRGQMDKRGVHIHAVGTVAIKHLLYSRLSTDADKAPEARLVRFSDDLSADYFGGLTAETYNPAKNRFEKRRGAPRNEPLDTWVYSYAATHHPELRLHRHTKADWDAREARLLKPANGEHAAANAQNAIEQSALSAPRQTQPARKKRWATTW